MEEGKIFTGFHSLATALKHEKTVIIEGFQGVFFHDFVHRLECAMFHLGLKVHLIGVHELYKEEDAIEQLVEPFLGEDDPDFGFKTTLEIDDFFDAQKMMKIRRNFEAVNIVYGPGAAKVGWSGPLLYIDLPKNEVQYRARAGYISNMGISSVDDPAWSYKRSFFVDWVVLNNHKRNLLPNIDIIVDGQHLEEPAWMNGDDFRQELVRLCHGVFRSRPWFEPGPWGGNWIKNNIAGVCSVTPNYAWSFELIFPENGIVFESSNTLLEISFDFLLYQDHKAILGRHAQRYGYHFPIRFDFLDTFGGGPLPIQCHPFSDYIREHFGEPFTQEESYYILDAEPGATCHLGFQNELDPERFQQALVESFRDQKPIEVEQFVKVLPSKKHDFFLIPPGTVHGSGVNNLVLEISTAPYIYTFKLYDWLRSDLDGTLRTIHLQHGLKNLVYDRKGELVEQELISKPLLIEKGDGWERYHLPTHEKHSYDVHRYHIRSSAEVKTEQRVHVLNMVGGKSINVVTSKGETHPYNYAETFVVSASVGTYKLINSCEEEAIVVVAFLK